MTYLDMIREVDRKLDTGEITLGEYEEMIEPLKREVRPDSDCVLKEFGNCSYSETGCADCEIKANIRNALSAQWKCKPMYADVSDTISRQAAIDVADAVWSVTGDKNVAKVWDQIKNLPSAQPEHTCVNCGRTVNNGGWYADGGTRCPIEEHYALPKDGYCHLWEKRDVTDDDYPERREE